MYPERRPYATTMPHSGYRAKPFVPQPPKDALMMLRSHIGYDDLQSGGSDQPVSFLRSAAGRTYLADGSSALSSTQLTAAQKLLPLTGRSSQAALDAARLEPPIEHASVMYHGCQQAVLNAELREKVEAHCKHWSARVEELQALLSDLPTESALHNTRAVENLHSYLGAYRCTEDMLVTPSEVAEQHALRTPVPEIDVMSQMPAIPMDTMRRALDDLLRSPYLLAPLDTHLAHLSLLDKLGQLSWSGEGEVTVPPSKKPRGQRAAARKDCTVNESEETGVVLQAEEAAAEEDIYPSRAAVAMHERLHYNPGDYAQRELKKSEEALRELQDRVQTAKRQKEEAIDAADPLTALRNLHAQVDFSNDLLLLYRARMALVSLHSDDTRDFRRDVVDLIDDSHQSVQAVHRYAREALPSVQHDVRALTEVVRQTQQQLIAMQATEAAADADMRSHLCDMDKAARVLWEEVGALLEKIAENARERGHYAQKCMSLREQRAKEAAAVHAQLQAQSAHCERLCRCEEVLTRWNQAGDLFGKYVDACVPKLLKHLAAVEESDADLAQREAEEYVGYYEQFVYAAEEARAKRCTQADRMRLLQRSTLLNQERASDTMDPDAAAHAQRLDDVSRELDEVQLYLKYVSDMEADRKAEVDPVLRGVLARQTQAQLITTGEEGEAEKPLPTPGMLEDAPAASAADAKPSPASPSTASEATKSTAAAPATAAGDGAVVAATTTTATTAPPSLSVTVAHPFVTARLIGLAHESDYLSQQGQLLGQEMQAVETKWTGLRHSREELQAMEEKYKNGDDIRALLGVDKP
ncbi:hypothetical protein, conserved [Leishmania donovani]|uniref:Paraflagellar rod family protein n=1 Tax=Leishmania donovani TaxID=5661 RepID=E9B942_LEIDO|nr:hypothetical protein, conserved [Leishmania donovani]CBZ31765.1 hypothetical protein, conserved [Leishmania donovani]